MILKSTHTKHKNNILNNHHAFCLQQKQTKEGLSHIRVGYCQHHRGREEEGGSESEGRKKAGEIKKGGGSQGGKTQIKVTGRFDKTWTLAKPEPLAP